MDFGIINSIIKPIFTSFFNGPENVKSKPVENQSVKSTSSEDELCEFDESNYKEAIEKSGIFAPFEKPKEQSMDELKEQQSQKQKEVEEARKEVSDIQSGSNEKIKSLQQKADSLKEEYEKALENDKKVSKELKEKQAKNSKEIKSKEDNKTKKEKDITNYENKITDCNAKIDNINAQISSLNDSLSSVEKKTDDNKDRWDEIDKQTASLKNKIANAKSELAKQKEALSNYKEKKDQAKQELDKIKDELDKLNEEKEKIEQEISKNCSDETKAKLEAYNNSKQQLEQTKTQLLSQAQSNLQQAQTELDRINEAINNHKDVEITFDDKIPTSKIAEVAKKYLGDNDYVTSDKMQEIMEEEGYAFHEGQWCADFASFAIGQAFKDSELPGDFESSSTCYKVGNWARDKGILMDGREDSESYDMKNVKPGDFVLYNAMEDNEWSHIGIVTEVHADGTFDTIEGNTSDDDGSDIYNQGYLNNHDNLGSENNHGRGFSFVLFNKIQR